MCVRLCIIEFFFCVYACIWWVYKRSCCTLCRIRTYIHTCIHTSGTRSILFLIGTAYIHTYMHSYIHTVRMYIHTYIHQVQNRFYFWLEQQMFWFFGRQSGMHVWMYVCMYVCEYVCFDFLVDNQACIPPWRRESRRAWKSKKIEFRGFFWTRNEFYGARLAPPWFQALFPGLRAGRRMHVCMYTCMLYMHACMHACMYMSMYVLISW